MEVALSDAGTVLTDQAPPRAGTRRTGVAITWMVARRLLVAAVTLSAVSVLVFAATQGLPGNTATAILGQNATPSQVASLSAQLDLNHSIVHQYLHWAGNLLRGDLGVSLSSQQPVSTVLAGRLETTLTLTGVAGTLIVLLSFLIGVRAAVRRDGLLDKLVTSVFSVVAAVPPFVIGIVLVVVLATGALHVFPAVSTVDSSRSLFSQMDLLVMPCAVLVITGMPNLTYLVRATMIETLESEYTAMARLNGIPERMVIWRHALPNALAPLAQSTAMTIAFLAGGAVSVEAVFGLPGLGLELVSAVSFRDLTVVQDLVLLSAAVFLVASLAADVLAVLVTPRVRTAL